MVGTLMRKVDFLGLFFTLALIITIVIFANLFHREPIKMSPSAYIPILDTHSDYELRLVRIYHYDACIKCCGKTNGITASGNKAKTNHTIAMDKSIPFGTVVYIDGIRYEVEDRGGGIKGNTIDIFVGSHEEAIAKGTFERMVLIYERQ